MADAGCVNTCLRFLAECFCLPQHVFPIIKKKAPRKGLVLDIDWLLHFPIDLNVCYSPMNTASETNRAGLTAENTVMSCFFKGLAPGTLWLSPLAAWLTKLTGKMQQLVVTLASKILFKILTKQPFCPCRARY